MYVFLHQWEGLDGDNFTSPNFQRKNLIIAIFNPFPLNDDVAILWSATTLWWVIFMGANFRGNALKINFCGFKFNQFRGVVLHKR